MKDFLRSLSLNITISCPLNLNFLANRNEILLFLVTKYT